MQIAPMNPWIHMYYATTGMNARGVLDQPAASRSRAQEVLSLYTKQNGWFVARGGPARQHRGRQARRPGGAEPATTSRSARSDLFKIRSDLTVVDGEIVYNSGALRWHGDRD